MTNLHPNKLPMFCERSQAQSTVKIPVSSIDSTCLKHINQVVNSNLIRKVMYPKEVLLNHDNVGILAKDLLVQMVCDSQSTKTQSEDSAGNNVLLKSLENNSTLLNLQEEPPLPVQNTYITYVHSAKPLISDIPNGECKLQIGSVYSLYNDSQTN